MNTDTLAVWLKNSLITTSIALSSAVSADAPSPSLEPFGSEVEGRLFSVAGSNTIGATLMKNFLLDYLQGKGAVDVHSVGRSISNEYRVQGYVGRKHVYVDVAAHGSSTGFRGLLGGDASVAMSSRRIKVSEVEQLSELGNLRSYASEQVIAIDGLAVIVHPANPIQGLSLNQLARVFSGEVDNWSAVGGDDAAIKLYARDANSGTWDTFDSLVLNGEYELSPRSKRFESNDELSDSVADDPNGIGFVGLASVRRSKSLAISEEGTEALKPEVLVVATEDYALSRRLFIYTAEQEQHAFIRDFLLYLQSDRGQRIVERTGFVSQNVISVGHEGGGDRSEAPASYRALLGSAERLSVNFRFAQGSAALDNKARRDIERIVSYMDRPGNSGKRVVLVGFGDEKQTERRAVILSMLRASAVKSALYKRGIMTEPVLGLGANLPVASNLNAGRAKNRRVEVWVQGSEGEEALRSR